MTRPAFDPFTGRLIEPRDPWPWVTVALDCVGIALACVALALASTLTP